MLHFKRFFNFLRQHATDSLVDGKRPFRDSAVPGKRISG